MVNFSILVKTELPHTLAADENWATPLAGRDVTESRVVPKRVGTGPFMLAGTYVVSGEGRMLVCAVGMCSQYARSACNGPRSRPQELRP
jgi:hypothetical protein